MYNRSKNIIRKLDIEIKPKACVWLPDKEKNRMTEVFENSFYVNISDQG